MNATTSLDSAARGRMLQAILTARDWARTGAWPPLVQLALRVALAVPFWKSGILKWSGFLELSDTAVALFTDEFMLHLPGGPYSFPAPAVTAFAAGCFEVVMPVLLVLGLGTRFAAAAMLGMALVIQLTVPDGWPIHLTWAALALALMAHGAGPMSIDHALARRLSGSTAGSR